MNDLKKIKIEAEQFIDHSILCLRNIKVDESFYEAIKLISKCEGIVVTTGMGKNNHIAKKISSTLSSLKIPSCSLHPGEALHGDSGIMRNKDILLVFSTEGILFRTSY